MSESLLSPEWYRVADLRPRLRGHVDIHRQTFRGDVWYVVQDHHSGKYHRLPPAANFIVALMNGKRTMQAIWERACERFGDEPPTQGEVIRLLSQLHASDLIASDLPPDMRELGERHARQTRAALLARIRNPMALKLPLLDPDRFLERTFVAVRWLYTSWGFALWLVLVVTGLVLAALNWSELTEGFADRVLAVENIMILVAAYPLVKLFHELGHGYATKTWGGVVHEVGVMFLVFIPVPYVDASSAAGFASKWHRAVVGGAGIMVELALASLAMIFWVNAEPGLLRAFAFNVMLIGSVSTVLFNGNPLLRFDGYFVFADLIEIPNLGPRSNRYFWYLARRMLGVQKAQSPVTARGEPAWLFGYAVLAFLYRVFISITIALFVASKFFIVGVLLAIWALSATFLMPILKGIRYLFTSPELRRMRARCLVVSGGILAAVAGGLMYLPVPHTTSVHGVVWLGPDTILRAGADGRVTEIVASGRVTAGTPVIRSTDPQLVGDLALRRLEHEEARLQLAALALSDRVQAGIFRERAALMEDQIDTLEIRRAGLTVTANTSGEVIVPDRENLPGRMVRQGDILGYVLGDAAMRVRVAVTQGRAELVRNRTQAIEIRVVSRPDRPIPARLVGEVPASGNRLPSRALSNEAGGGIVLNPAAREPLTTLEPVSQFILAVEADVRPSRIGERVHVKFDHGDEPLIRRLYRSARQLFMSRFSL